MILSIASLLIASSPLLQQAAPCPAHTRATVHTSVRCKREWMDENVRINQIQMIGTHNSYHLAIPPIVMRHFRQMNPTLAQEVDYASHSSLTSQLDMGLRQLEIDAYYDPQGGRYADPMGEHWIAEESHGTYHIKINPAMLNPGFKVLHMPDVDYRSSCVTYIDCLKEIRVWSKHHPGHLPIFIHGNAKGPAKANSPDVLKMDGWTQTQALPFDNAAFDALDKEVLSVFRKDEIIMPEDVIGSTSGLKEGIEKNGWPTLRQARGKVIFVIDGSAQQARLYEHGDQQMKGRVFFVDSHDPTSTDAGYTVVIDSRGNIATVQHLVTQGFIVRTLADFLTVEPRTGDYSRAYAAFASGAQVISTDYYRPDPKFKFPYHLTGFPGGSWVRCDPLNAPSGCEADLLDPYIHNRH